MLKTLLLLQIRVLQRIQTMFSFILTPTHHKSLRILTAMLLVPAMPNTSVVLVTCSVIMLGTVPNLSTHLVSRKAMQLASIAS